MRFKIEHISTGTPCHLLARQLDDGNFSVSQSSTLGGVGIRDSVTQPRALTPDGLPDLTVFAFQLCMTSDRSLITADSIVELRSD